MPPTSKAIQGFKAFLDISIDGGSTFKRIGELRDVTLTVDGEPIDVTSHDTAPDREFITGLRTWTMSAEMLHVDTDAAQDDIFSALNTDIEIQVEFFPIVKTGTPKFTGEGIITSWELTGPNDDAAAKSIEIQGNGPLTEAAQT